MSDGGPNDHEAIGLSQFGRTASIQSVNPLNVEKQISAGGDSSMNFAFAAHMQVEDSFHKTFHQMKEIKRRNPEQYIKNPTKSFCLSQGNKDYAIHDIGRATRITEHGN